MEPFITLTSVAAPMPDADTDTDIIFPARFLTLPDKHGLGHHAFHDRRYDSQGTERPEFVLNQAPWREARILIAGPNFGSGSSREQAPWALLDFGVCCIVAPGFGDIFEANCYRNGLLPIRLGGEVHAQLMADAQAGRELTVDLKEGVLTRADGSRIAFSVPDDRRVALLNGHDDIDLILRHEQAHIAAFAAAQRQQFPWLHQPLR